MKIWSTMLYNAATSREITQGIAYFAISFPIFSVSKNVFAFCSISVSSLNDVIAPGKKSWTYAFWPRAFGMKLGAVSARQTVTPSNRLHKRSEGRRYELRSASASRGRSRRKAPSGALDGNKKTTRGSQPDLCGDAARCTINIAHDDCKSQEPIFSSL